MTTLAQINPSDLLVDTNIRTDLALDKAFLGSIKERGVIVPIVAMNTDDGVRVIAGHRRTAAAVAANLTDVPVVIVDTPDQADRIIDQLAENDHRTAITAADRADAVQQLALLGVSAAQITKRTKLSRDLVDAAISLADREDKTALLAEYPITVAAWIAEYDGDENAQDRIQRAYRWKGEGEARHEVERLRAHQATIENTHKASRVIANDYNCATTVQRPGFSSAAETLDRLGLDESDHAATCDGHLLFVEQAYIAEPCDHTDHTEDAACWEDDSDPIYAQVDAVAYTAVAYCSDWQAHGHTHPWKSAPATTTGTSSNPGEQDAAKEAARIERKRVIAGNKAWAASHAVRAEFIDALANRKSAIPGGAIFAVESLQDSRDLHATYGHRPITTDGMTATQATNALVLWILRSRHADCTADQGKSLWRQGGNHSTAIARFLRYLETIGYTLSTAEEAAAGGQAYTLPTEN